MTCSSCQERNRVCGLTFSSLFKGILSFKKWKTTFIKQHKKETHMSRRGGEKPCTNSYCRSSWKSRRQENWRKVRVKVIRELLLLKRKGKRLIWVLLWGNPMRMRSTANGVTVLNSGMGILVFMILLSMMRKNWKILKKCINSRKSNLLNYRKNCNVRKIWWMTSFSSMNKCLSVFKISKEWLSIRILRDQDRIRMFLRMHRVEPLMC